MKSIKKYIKSSGAILLATTLLLTACNSDELMNGAENGNCVKIANATVDAGAKTRMAIESDAFATGDKIGICSSIDKTIIGSYERTATGWDYSQALSWNQGGGAETFYAWYPCGEGINHTNFTLPADQSGTGTAGNSIEKANYMTAQTIDYNGRTANGSIDICFGHRMSKVVIKIKAGEANLTDAAIYSYYPGFTDNVPTMPNTEAGTAIMPHVVIQGNGADKVYVYTALVVPMGKTDYTLFSVKKEGETDPYKFISNVWLSGNKVYEYTLTLQANGVCQLSGLTVNTWIEKNVGDGGSVMFNWADKKSANYSGGTGTIFDPYQIATAGDLALLADNNTSNSYYKQTAHIDLKGGYWKPIGGENSFSGNYQGNGYAIKNMTVLGDAAPYSGLFGQMTNATIIGVRLENATVSNAVGNAAGTLVGYAQGSHIIACTAQGTVIGNGTCGGLVGNSQNSEIAYCGTEVSVRSVATGAAGGIAGTAEGKIVSSFACGTAETSDFTAHKGLLVGSSAGNLAISYSVANVAGDLCGNKGTGYTETGCTTTWNNALATLTNAGANYTYQKTSWVANQCWIAGTSSSLPQLTAYAYEGDKIVTTITTAEQLRNLSSGNDYKLGADIEIAETDSWTPLIFSGGTLDGQGHIITVKTVMKTAFSSSRGSYIGFFAQLGDGAVVKNLTLKLAGVEGAAAYTGGLAGFTEGTVSIDNVHLEGTTTEAAIKTTGGEGVGGLIGYFSGNLSITRSSCNININATNTKDACGGLVGYGNSDDKLTLVACHSGGTINHRGGTDQLYSVGGLVGMTYDGFSSITYNIESCYSTCNITTDSDDYAGRLCGILTGDATNTFSYNASTNITVIEKGSDAKADWGCGYSEYKGTPVGNAVAKAESKVYGVVANTANTAEITILGTKYTVKDLWKDNAGALPTLKVNKDGTTPTE